MKRAYFVCLFQFLATTFLLSQANPVPLINQSGRVVSGIRASQSDPKAQAKILDSYGKLPLTFEANSGQTDKRVKFLSRTGGYTLFLTGDEAVLSLRAKNSSPRGLKPASLAVSSGTPKQVAEKLGLPCEKERARLQPCRPEPVKTGALAPEEAIPALRMKLRNANPAARVTGVDELAGTSNYFVGNVKLAEPLLNAPVPSTVVPFMNVTVSPSGGGPALETTTAVNVTACP